MQAIPDVGPIIMQIVVVTMSKVHDTTSVVFEINALLMYVLHMFAMQEVIKLQKQWDIDRQAKVILAIAKAMKQWNDDHYSCLLHATWGWHPFHLSALNLHPYAL